MSPRFEFRLPEDLQRRIQAVADQKNVKIAHVIREALELYLDAHSMNENARDTLSQIQSELTDHEKRISKLESE